MSEQNYLIAKFNAKQTKRLSEIARSGRSAEARKRAADLLEARQLNGFSERSITNARASERATRAVERVRAGYMTSPPKRAHVQSENMGNYNDHPAWKIPGTVPGKKGRLHSTRIADDTEAMRRERWRP